VAESLRSKIQEATNHSYIYYREKRDYRRDEIPKSQTTSLVRVGLRRMRRFCRLIHPCGGAFFWERDAGIELLAN
jgi:hypothetical protein